MTAIIDYDTGNLRSVAEALRRAGAEFTVTADPATLLRAERVILPGVGEASSAMARLREKGLDTLVPALTCPVLGICIGMQLLCRSSEEGSAMNVKSPEWCGKDAMAYISEYYQEFEGGNYQYDVNQARVEALDYVMDYKQRLGISVSSYFRVSGEKYVQLKKTYKNLMCLPATSSSVERSFSVHGCFLTSRRMNLSLKTMAYLMLIRMNFVLAERQGWEKELQQYIDTKARIFNCT